MPKKFVSENTKAVAAKARKSIAREEEKNKREKQLADEYWKDDDKYVIKKQQRKVRNAFWYFENIINGYVFASK